MRAAEICLEAGLANSAASRAYYAMFQAAQVALKAVGVTRMMWSHPGLQASFASEVIMRRKLYPPRFRDYLSVGLGVRQAADYGYAGVSMKMSHRLMRKAGDFVHTVERIAGHGTRS